MTYKFVGALRGITTAQPHVMKALKLGILIGLGTEIVRKLVKRNTRYLPWSRATRGGRIFDFVFDAFLLPSPYASSFGGSWSCRRASGGRRRHHRLALRSRAGPDQRAPGGPADAGIPTDMKHDLTGGGGLIAGDSLAALSVGLYGCCRRCSDFLPECTEAERGHRAGWGIQSSEKRGVRSESLRREPRPNRR